MSRVLLTQSSIALHSLINEFGDGDQYYFRSCIAVTRIADVVTAIVTVIVTILSLAGCAGYPRLVDIWQARRH